ncbi:hypothetical protein OROGR_027922 [Orobanche gracilis]
METHTRPYLRVIELEMDGGWDMRKLHSISVDTLGFGMDVILEIDSVPAAEKDTYNMCWSLGDLLHQAGGASPSSITSGCGRSFHSRVQGRVLPHIALYGLLLPLSGHRLFQLFGADPSLHGLNTYGSFDRDIQISSGGGLVQDRRGELLVAVHSSLQASSSYDVEIKTLTIGLTFASHHFSHIWTELDIAEVVTLLSSGHQGSWQVERHRHLLLLAAAEVFTQESRAGCSPISLYTGFCCPCRVHRLFQLFGADPSLHGLNTYGSFDRDIQISSGGGLVQDRQGELLVAVHSSLQASSSYNVEIKTLTIGLTFASHHFSHIWIELDIAAAVTLLSSGHQGSWQVQHPLMRMCHIIKDIEYRVALCFERVTSRLATCVSWASLPSVFRLLVQTLLRFFSHLYRWIS